MAFALTPGQRRSFADDGYLVVPNPVPQRTVNEALRAVNHSIGALYDAAPSGTNQAPDVSDLREDPAILGLLRSTQVIEAATDLVGAPLDIWGLPQVALRFPVREPAPEAHGPAHIDGVPVSGAGFPEGGRRLHGFTVLVGVFLSDVSEPRRGNFTVWPGTHHLVAEWLRRHGPELEDPEEFLNADLPRIAEARGQGVPVTAQAGDLLLAHYLLLHAIGVNAGPNIRYAAFFRLERDGHEGFGDKAYTEVWAEWEAMRPPHSFPRKIEQTRTRLLRPGG